MAAGEQQQGQPAVELVVTEQRQHVADGADLLLQTVGWRIDEIEQLVGEPGVQFDLFLEFGKLGAVHDQVQQFDHAQPVAVEPVRRGRLQLGEIIALEQAERELAIRVERILRFHVAGDQGRRPLPWIPPRAGRVPAHRNWRRPASHRRRFSGTARTRGDRRNRRGPAGYPARPARGNAPEAPRRPWAAGISRPLPCVSATGRARGDSASKARC